MLKGKQRLDEYVAANGLAESREKAKALILAGEVMVNGATVIKPSTAVTEGDSISIKQQMLYVSRGGYKLEKAIQEFLLSIEGFIAADIGASTGGFTDCMLSHGAGKVYAVDVGYGQLNYKLRIDARVIVMERTNARNMQKDWFASPLQFASIDVSFISVRLILAPLYDCLENNAHVVVLLKPQFEAGREKVGKKGVVKDAMTHTEVIRTIMRFARQTNYAVRGLSFSPIKGPEGNIEFLLLLQKSEQNAWEEYRDEEQAKKVVTKAHAALL